MEIVHKYSLLFRIHLQFCETEEGLETKRKKKKKENGKNPYPCAATPMMYNIGAATKPLLVGRFSPVRRRIPFRGTNGRRWKGERRVNTMNPKRGPPSS